MRLTYNEWQVLEDALARGRQAIATRTDWLRGYDLEEQYPHIAYEQSKLKALDSLLEKITRADRAGPDRGKPDCGHACVDHQATVTQRDIGT